MRQIRIKKVAATGAVLGGLLLLSTVAACVGTVTTVMPTTITTTLTAPAPAAQTTAGATTQPAAQTTTPTSPTPAGGSASTGQQLFASNCSACHGANGAGGLKIGTATSADLRWPSLGPTYNSDTSLIARAILDGKDQDGQDLDPVMPRWSGKLSDQDISNIIAYLETLK